MTSPALRLFVLALCASALFVAHPGSGWAWIPALLALFGWLGLLVCLGEYLNRGRR